jgi:hypothetical protein
VTGSAVVVYDSPPGISSMVLETDRCAGNEYLSGGRHPAVFFFENPTTHPAAANGQKM